MSSFGDWVAVSDMVDESLALLLKCEVSDGIILVEADFLVNIFEGSLEQNKIDDIKKRYFKTERGIGLVSSMWSKVGYSYLCAGKK